MSSEIAERLGNPVTEQELNTVLKRMARGKVAGVDGLPTEFYLMFGDVLIPKLVDMFTAAW